MKKILIPLMILLATTAASCSKDCTCKSREGEVLEYGSMKEDNCRQIEYELNLNYHSRAEWLCDQ